MSERAALRAKPWVVLELSPAGHVYYLIILSYKITYSFILIPHI